YDRWGEAGCSTSLRQPPERESVTPCDRASLTRPAYTRRAAGRYPGRYASTSKEAGEGTASARRVFGREAATSQDVARGPRHAGDADVVLGIPGQDDRDGVARRVALRDGPRADRVEARPRRDADGVGRAARRREHEQRAVSRRSEEERTRLVPREHVGRRRPEARRGPAIVLRARDVPGRHEEKESRIEAPRFGDGRDPPGKGMERREVELQPSRRQDRPERPGASRHLGAPGEELGVGRSASRDRQDSRLLESLAARRDGEASERRSIRRDRPPPFAGRVGRDRRRRARLPVGLEVARVELSAGKDDRAAEETRLVAFDAEDLDPSAYRARVTRDDQRGRVARCGSLPVQIEIEHVRREYYAVRTRRRSSAARSSVRF